MVFRLAASATNGKVLEMSICGLHPRLAESETLGIGTSNLDLANFLSDSYAHKSWRVMVQSMFWTYIGERVCVCVCVSERDRDRDRYDYMQNIHIGNIKAHI